MFGMISKKKLAKYMEEVKAENRAGNMGQKYGRPISEEQRLKNVYCQGYEDGTDNFFNAVSAHFNLRKKDKR